MKAGLGRNDDRPYTDGSIPLRYGPDPVLVPRLSPGRQARQRHMAELAKEDAPPIPMRDHIGGWLRRLAGWIDGGIDEGDEE